MVLKRILRRLLAALPILLVVSLLIFLVTQVLPGDTARAVLGETATADQIAALRAELGLDRSIPMQYLDWLAHLLRGDFGRTLGTRDPIAGLITAALGNSLTLVALAACISFPLSLLLAVACALRREGVFDHTIMLGSLCLNALPEFVKGLLLVIVFSTGVWQWLPAVAVIPPGESLLGNSSQIVLPCAVLVLSATPYLTRLLRASLIEVLDSEFVQLARLKGMRPATVVWRHALPNAMVPTVQAAALSLALMLGGVVVTEYLFRFPGMGSLLTDAIGNRDLPLVQAITLVFAATYLLVNIAADALSDMLMPQTTRAA